MGKFDIFLNGLGYLLMRDSKGRLMDGAAREQAVDPFSSHLTEDKWQTATFKFGEGAGRKRYDSSERYRWGFGSDTRSGRFMLGPYVDFDIGTLDESIATPASVTARSIQTGLLGTPSRVAFQFLTGNAVKYRSFGIMVRRDPTVDYSTAADFQVELWTDAGNVPGCIACTPSRTNHTAAPLRVLKNRTGTTALSRTACLVQSSYTPRNNADKRLAAIQCMKSDG